MEEKIINGIKYCLNHKKLTAEVIRKRGYSGDIVIPETVVNQNVSYKVTCIDASAFAKCASLTFKGTINQWKEIDCTDEDYVVHCIDGIYDFE